MTADAQTTLQPAASAAPLIERRFDVAGWATLVFGLALLVSSAAQLAYRLTLPTDGWSFTGGAIGTELQDTITYSANLLGRPSPLRPGDFVLAVEGYPYPQLLRNAEALGPPLLETAAGTTARYTVQRGDTVLLLDVPQYRWTASAIARRAFGNPEAPVRLADLAIGVFVFFKRPRELAARMLFFLSVVWMTVYISDIVLWGLPEVIFTPGYFAAVLFSNWIWGGLAAPTLLLLALSFPRPKPFVQRHTALATLAIYSVLPLLVLGFGAQAFLGWGWTAVCGLLSLLSIVHTLFTARDPVSRAQLRWAGLGVACLALSILIASSSGFELYPAAVQQLLAVLDPLLRIAFPAALAVAILRYRLFDIDLILSRALIYGALTLCVAGIYIAIVAYLGALFRSEDNLIASLIATGVVAVVFQPLRVWLQRGVNRLLFGQRDEPYAVIATLGRHLDTTSAPDAVYSGIVETIGQALKLPYVAILAGDSAQPRAVYGQHPPGQLLRLPLSYQNRELGELLVAPRAGQQRFDDADRKLLHDLARQTGIAVYAARMTADVQRSRERIVLAREEERRRLRRDLHDGLGPQLASQSLTLDVIARRLRSDPQQAAELLIAVREQVQQAVGEIRDLIYGLRPPVLDDLGLDGAIQELADRAQQHGRPRFTLRLAPIDAPLPAAVEVAAYRIIQEAVTNVVRHAGANMCEIRLGLLEAQDDAGAAVHGVRLAVEIVDDGVGIAAGRQSGIGLQSMRERAEELGGQTAIEAAPGGGTRIRAWLPVASRSEADGYYHLDG